MWAHKHTVLTVLQVLRTVCRISTRVNLHGSVTCYLQTFGPCTPFTAKLLKNEYRNTTITDKIGLFSCGPFYFRTYA